MNDPRRVTRDGEHRMAGGVCAGLAAYYGWDPTLVRVLMVLALVPAGPLGLAAYGAAWLLMPAVEDAGNPRDVMRANAADMAVSARSAATQLAGAARGAVGSRFGGESNNGRGEPGMHGASQSARSADTTSANAGAHASMAAGAASGPAAGEGGTMPTGGTHNATDPARNWANVPGRTGANPPEHFSPTPSWPPPQDLPAVDARPDQPPPTQPGTPGA